MIELDTKALENKANTGVRHVYVIRHGHYGDDHNLNDEGRAQMKGLASAIKDISEGNRYLVLASSVPRAYQSATILAEELSGELEAAGEDLLFDYAHEEVMDYFNQRRNKAESIIMVGHLDFVNTFPVVLSRAEGDLNIPYKEIYKGTGIHIDLEKRVYEEIPKRS